MNDIDARSDDLVCYNMETCLNQNCNRIQKENRYYCHECLQRHNISNTEEQSNTSIPEVLSDELILEPSIEIKRALHTANFWISLKSIQPDKKGLQHIDSKKEIFVKYQHNDYTDLRSNSSLRSLTPPIHTYIEDLITNFIIHEADKLVNKLEGRVVKLIFSGFAILFAYSSEFPQIPHIDVEASDYIFIYVLGDRVVPSTLVYKGPEITDEQAAEFLNLPQDIKTVQIGHYKNLFQSRADIVKNMKPISEEGWQPGTLCVLKGGKVHAAPKHNEPRAVLVFFGTPDNASDTYKNDTQWHTWSVISDLLLKNKEFNADMKSRLMKAHTKVIGDWLIDERCLRHASFLSDVNVATEHLQSFLPTQNKVGKRKKK